ncbi:hypothetical protein I4F81_003422 [Pyropia yezoensis]|uniref:Uncharacterized protein n=1 Tax=Pyropia yezoensis TaxID=2788 RepID=A0ACC3BS36_PYRYE|nr:hypothetical protein I4F81_003422 [Neopyropia yezoensis]
MADVTLADVEVAAARLAGVAHVTPLLTCASLDDALSGGTTRFYFKAEALQRTGSFKFRGAYNAAVAAAAAAVGARAHIVVPAASAAVKRAAIKAYGGVITTCGAPSPLDALIVPVGSGAMLAGVCAVLRATPAGRAVRVFGAQPAAAAGAARSLAAGKRLPNNAADAAATAADGLRADLGVAGWAALSRGDVQAVLVVPEAEVARWMRVVWERLKLTIEPSAAVGVAAAAGAEFGALGLRSVGVVLCGGNVDLEGGLPWQRGGA